MHGVEKVKLDAHKTCIIRRAFPANIYLFKGNDRNTRKRCEIYSKLTIKTPERRQWQKPNKSLKTSERPAVSTVNFSSTSEGVIQRKKLWILPKTMDISGLFLMAWKWKWKKWAIDCAKNVDIILYNSKIPVYSWH